MNPLHGEIWEVNLDPTIGDEMQKTRPAIVLSGSALMNYGTRIVVPITGWKEDAMRRRLWFVQIDADNLNGLSKPSAAACHHVRSVSTLRFARRVGRLNVEDLDEVKTALVVSLDIRTR